MKSDLTVRLAEKLGALRATKGWTLDQLAAQSGVSRAALSRLENVEVSPSADVLYRLSRAHGISLSHMMAMVEDGYGALISRDEQALIRDGEAGVVKRVCSPGTAALSGEVLEYKMAAGASLVEEGQDAEGREFHLVLSSGHLSVEHSDKTYILAGGDVLRFRQHGPVRYQALEGLSVKFMLFAVTPG